MNSIQVHSARTNLALKTLESLNISNSFAPIVRQLIQLEVATLHDATSHAWHVLRDLPSAAFNGSLPQHMWHAWYTFAHLVFAASVPFTIVYPSAALVVSDVLRLRQYTKPVGILGHAKVALDQILVTGKKCSFENLNVLAGSLVLGALAGLGITWLNGASARNEHISRGPPYGSTAYEIESYVGLGIIAAISILFTAKSCPNPAKRVAKKPTQDYPALNKMKKMAQMDHNAVLITDRQLEYVYETTKKQLDAKKVLSSEQIKRFLSEVGVPKSRCLKVPELMDYLGCRYLYDNPHLYGRPGRGGNFYTYYSDSDEATKQEPSDRMSASVVTFESIENGQMPPSSRLW